MTQLADKPTVPDKTSTTMRAAVLVSPGVFEVQDVAIPEPAANQIRVQIEGCGVCASNIPPYEGREWFKYPFAPGQLGHEGWGYVDALGTNVKGFEIGQRVAFLSEHAYAEFDVVDEQKVVALPPALDDEPFPAEPLACAINTFKRSDIRSGQTVAIIGIGFLGSLLTQMVHQIGGKTIAIARRPFALGIAQQMGADHTIAMDDHWKIIEQVKQINTDGCDVVIECVGKQWPLDLAGELVRERGRLIVAGYHQDGLRTCNMQMWNWKGIDVINAHERDPQVYVDGMKTAVRAVADGSLNAASLYTHQFSLERLGDALEMTRTRPDGFMKALILM